MSIRVRGIAVFLLIAFAGTWAYLFTARLLLGWSLVNPLVQLPGAVMPAVAAVVVRRWVTREGFADAGLRLRGGWRVWLSALGLPLLATALMLACAAAGGWWRAPGLPALAGTVAFLLIVAVVTTPLYWGEEFGWTSFLWPRLVPGRPKASLWATGAIWAVWHWPLAWLGYAQLSNHTTDLLLWSAVFVLYEVMLCYLYARSGSVWVPSLAHAANNMVTGLVAEQLGGAGPTVVMGCTVVALAVTCLPLLRSGALRSPTPTPTPTRAVPVSAR